MLTAGAGMLPSAAALPGVGASLAVPPALTSTLSSFNSLPITSQFSSVVTSATGSLGGGVLDSLRTLGADSFPALTNAIPANFASSLNTIAPGGMFGGGLTGLINGAATNLMGAGDLTQFSQIFSSAEGMLQQANQFINSNLNIGALSSTFGQITGGMDNILTGSINQISQAFGSLGGDLGNLGNLINMGDLGQLGDPSALVKQLANVGGLVPGVDNILREAGLSTGQISNLVSGDLAGIADSANKLLYEGMTKITGSELEQVKSLLNVNTPGIQSMADLLDPKKILPNSFPTLTMPTPDGLRGIYADAQGAVNTNLEKFLSTTVPTVKPTVLTQSTAEILI